MKLMKMFILSICLLTWSSSVLSVGEIERWQMAKLTSLEASLNTMHVRDDGGLLRIIGSLYGMKMDDWMEVLIWTQP